MPNLIRLAAPLALSAGLAQAKDIVGTAASAGSFKTLVAAIEAAGLAESLKGPGPFIAPTDEALAKLPAGTVETLLKPENKNKLVQILTDHVVPGTVMSGDVAGTSTQAKSVEGSLIEVDASNGVVMVDEAKGRSGGHRRRQPRHPRHRHRHDAELSCRQARGRRSRAFSHQGPSERRALVRRYSRSRPISTMANSRRKSRLRAGSSTSRPPV